ncbi:MAG TPA: VOC family protein [Solirubrobacteraceae bacterium]
MNLLDTNPTEVFMSGTQLGSDSETQRSGAMAVAMRLEVVTVPVADVDRAKRFYQSLGWRLDADIAGGDDFRVVQFTPPLSECSIHFGKGLTASAPGSADRLILAVEDINAAREALIDRGVDVGEVYEARPPGSDATDRSYFAYAAFSDPDGNRWLLQEITKRLPGRTWDE